jgi:prepilin-type N-terminal cleavage/methylation domain-containing protein
VKRLATRQGFLKDERGFTLPEMMVTTVIMIVVLLALFSIFDMSLKVFSFGNNKVEAAESARVGMEKMEREIRAAYPVDADNGNTHLFFNANGSISNPPQAMPTATQITFGNELGAEGAGNDKIECGTPCEYITYKLSAPSTTAPCTLSPCSTLLRVNTANSTDSGDPVVENVVPGGLTFTYLKSNGTTLATSESDIRIVLVSLDIAVHPGTNNEATQELTTVIDLRNR